jgi:hypothetical protein
VSVCVGIPRFVVLSVPVVAELSHKGTLHIMRYFKRNWDERRGDEHDHWGTSTWYFETEPDMWPTRQIEVYANGRVLRYDHQHIEDDFGKLSDVALDAAEFAPYAIAQSEFERVWNSGEPFQS